MADRNNAPPAESGPLVTELAFANFKALADVRIEFRSRFTLVVGRNASGKSSVLDGIDLASQMLVPQPGEYRMGGRPYMVFSGVRQPERMITRGSTSALKLILETPAGQFGAIAWPESDDRNAGRFRAYWKPAGSKPLQEQVWPHNSVTPQLETLGAEATGLGAVVRFRLDARAAVRASVPPRGRDQPRIEHDGSGLPSVLAWLAGNSRATIAAIETALAEVVPGAGTITTPNDDVESWYEEDVRIGDDVVRRRAKRTEVGNALNLEMFGMGAMPADLLSEGTVLVLALLTALHAPTCPRVVLLDDIDAALHPAAQAALIEALRRVLTLKPDVQIIATTHSPYLLDSFEPQDVIVLRSDPKSGHAHARSLAEHPEAVSTKGLLRTGELWSSVGDDWIYGDAEAPGVKQT